MRTHAGFRRNVRPRTTFQRAQGIRGRYAGYYQKSGYYGRFSGKGGELKFFDTTIDDAAIAATMTINNLTVVPQGTSESTRIGRKMTVRKILWKYTMTLAASAANTSTSDNVKVMLVQDTQTNGAQFAAAQLIDTDVWDSFRNLANSTRFRVLYSKDIRFVSMSGSGRGTTDTLAFGEDIHTLTGSKSCNIPIEYDNSATDGSIGTVRTNNLYWVTQSTSGFCSSLGTARIRFSDN